MLAHLGRPAHLTRVIEASEEAPCLALSLKLDISIVREFLAREEFQIPEAPPDTPAMSTGPVTPELLDAWRRLLDLLSTPEDIPFLSGFIEREIIYRILRGPEAARLRAVATLGDQSHRTAKAIAWIKTNYARPLHIEELAEIAGMAVSTLHHHFRALTAMGPLQYQKQIRLQAARARMLADDVDAATVAFEVGYESASQFNREYSGCSASHLFVTSRPCVRRRLRDSNPWPRPAKCLNSLLIFHIMPSPLRRGSFFPDLQREIRNTSWFASRKLRN
jgi:AraC-like DNA-binding protein